MSFHLFSIRRLTGKYIFILGLFFFLLGCSTLPTDLSQNPAAIEAQRLMSPTDPFQAFKATGNIAVTQNNITERTRMGLATQYPHRIRLEVFLPIGTTLYTIVSNENHLYVQDYITHSYYVAAATERTLSRAIGIPIVPSDLICLLFGRIPLRTITDATYIDLATRKNLPKEIHKGISVWDASSVRYDVFMDDKSRPLLIQYSEKNKPILVVTLSNWKNENESWVPRKLRWKDPNKLISLEILIDKVWPGETISVDLYKLDAPHEEKREGTS